MSLKSKLLREKPWAKLRKSRQEYERDQPWKRAKLSREKFEAMVALIPDELIDQLKLESDAHRLLEGAFGKAALEDVQEEGVRPS